MSCMTERELTRRRLLALGLALPPLAALAGSDLFAGELLAATPAIADDDDPDPRADRGPLLHAELAAAAIESCLLAPPAPG